MLVGQAPEEPEALGLLALMLHLDARRPARRVAGRYVPLEQQDVALWRRDLIGEAETLLRLAGNHARAGRYQYEAAIQSAHAGRAFRGQSDWPAITLLYGALADLTVRRSPSSTTPPRSRAGPARRRVWLRSTHRCAGAA